MTAFVGRYQEGMKFIDEGLSVASKLDEPECLCAVLFEKAISHLGYMEHVQVVEAGMRSAAIMRETGNLWELVHVLAFVDLSLVQLGRFVDAKNVQEEFLPIAERIGHLPAVLVAGRARGMREFFETADFDALAQMARADQELCERTGLRWEGHSLTWQGLVEFLKGNWVGALPHFEEGARRTPPGILEGFGPAFLFLCCAYLGQDEECAAILEQQRPNLPRSGQPNFWGSWLLLFCVVEGLMVLGKADQAAALCPLVREASKTSTVLTGYHDGRLLERALGMAAAVAREWDEAEAHYEHALGLAQQVPHRIEQLETRRLYAAMLLDRQLPGDRDRARRLGSEAIEGYRGLGMPRHVEMTQELLARC